MSNAVCRTGSSVSLKSLSTKLIGRWEFESDLRSGRWWWCIEHFFDPNWCTQFVIHFGRLALVCKSLGYSKLKNSNTAPGLPNLSDQSKLRRTFLAHFEVRLNLRLSMYFSDARVPSCACYEMLRGCEKQFHCHKIWKQNDRNRVA